MRLTMLMQQQDPAFIVLWRVMGSESGSCTGRVVWEAGTPGMGNGLVLARVAGQGLKGHYDSHFCHKCSPFICSSLYYYYTHTHTFIHTFPLSNARQSWGWKKSLGHTMCLASVCSDRLKDRMKRAELNWADWRASGHYGHYTSLPLSFSPELDSWSWGLS